MMRSGEGGRKYGGDDKLEEKKWLVQWNST